LYLIGFSVCLIVLATDSPRALFCCLGGMFLYTKKGITLSVIPCYFVTAAYPAAIQWVVIRSGT
jgi:hypothetical protein